MTNFATYLETYISCAKQYIGFQKQSVIVPLKVLAKSLKTVFEKDHFITLLYQNSIKKYEDDLEL